MAFHFKPLSFTNINVPRGTLQERKNITFTQLLILVSINSILEYFLIKWEIKSNIDLFYALNHKQVDKELKKYEDILNKHRF